MSSEDFKLIVGLGNPGAKYTMTRHNVGFMAIEKLAEKKNTLFRINKKIIGEIAEIGLGNEKKILLLPKTFMNESGKSVKAAMKWYGIQPNQILIILDDIDMPLGKLRMRSKGGSGGHNGLKSIINHLGTEHFYRLKIGIGKPLESNNDKRETTVSHVLGRFNAKELKTIEILLNEILLGLDLIKKTGLEKTATHLNSIKSNITDI